MLGQPVLSTNLRSGSISRQNRYFNPAVALGGVCSGSPSTWIGSFLWDRSSRNGAHVDATVRWLRVASAEDPAAPYSHRVAQGGCPRSLHHHRAAVVPAPRRA